MTITFTKLFKNIFVEIQIVLLVYFWWHVFNNHKPEALLGLLLGGFDEHVWTCYWPLSGEIQCGGQCAIPRFHDLMQATLFGIASPLFWPLDGLIPWHFDTIFHEHKHTFCKFALHMNFWSFIRKNIGLLFQKNVLERNIKALSHSVIFLSTCNAILL